MENRLLVLETSQLQSSGLFTQLYELMPIKRKEKIDSFRFEKDKYLSLAAGALVEYALSDLDKDSRKISYGSHGKPYLERGDLHFNLSHCDGIAVCAVSDSCVGVDAEGIRTVSDRLIQRVLLPDEIKWVNSYGLPEEKNRAFLRLWTVKESVMKYLGAGLSLGPERIGIKLDGPLAASCEEYDLSGVRFTEFDLDKRHITVCSQYGSFVSRPIMLTAQMIFEKIKAASER